MLKRKAYQKLNYWFDNSQSALLVTGARQVGKTFLITCFLQEKAKSFVCFNLLENALAREAFNTSQNADEIILKLSALSEFTLVENETIIFIDEIQAANDAITPMKFLVQDKRFRYIISGSLLGIELQNILSIPAGFLESFTMYPLDFEEFMMANNVSDRVFSHLKDCYVNQKEVDAIIHQTMIKLFNLYLIVGGFPEAVNSYKLEKNLKKVKLIQEKIDFAYKYDISKYDKERSLLIKDIYNSIPSELNSQNKRMILKNINNKSRFYLYEDSFVWLLNSGIGLFTYNVDNPIFPLLSSKERTLFKLFLNDVGLLSSVLLKEDIVRILNGDVCINFGSLYENVVAQELTAKGYNLFYYNSKKNGEVDFLIEESGSVIPIEVKSGKDYKRHVALTKLLANPDYNIHKAYVFSSQNLKKVGNVIYYPIYLIIFIKDENQENEQIYDLDLSDLM